VHGFPTGRPDRACRSERGARTSPASESAPVPTVRLRVSLVPPIARHAPRLWSERQTHSWSLSVSSMS
jgi:hypothetical protein